MIRNVINNLRFALEHAEKESKIDSDDLLVQTSFQVGWLKNAIRTAIDDLEDYEIKTT